MLSQCFDFVKSVLKCVHSAFGVHSGRSKCVPGVFSVCLGCTLSVLTCVSKCVESVFKVHSERSKCDLSMLWSALWGFNMCVKVC